VRAFEIQIFASSIEKQIVSRCVHANLELLAA
jgi:hypothetical protein